MLYGRVSFAILEDRKFKDGPDGKVNTWPGRPDHIKNDKIDIASLDKPGLSLLGKRQLHFLKEWGKDWRGADLKVALSQTIFCNLANYHGGNQMYLVADLDSNGWPQSGRNRAVHALRKAMPCTTLGSAPRLNCTSRYRQAPRRWIQLLRAQHRSRLPKILET